MMPITHPGNTRSSIARRTRTSIASCSMVLHLVLFNESRDRRHEREIGECIVRLHPDMRLRLPVQYHLTLFRTSREMQVYKMPALMEFWRKYTFHHAGELHVGEFEIRFFFHLAARRIFCALTEFDMSAGDHPSIAPFVRTDEKNLAILVVREHADDDPRSLCLRHIRRPDTPLVFPLRGTGSTS